MATRRTGDKRSALRVSGTSAGLTLTQPTGGTGGIGGTGITTGIPGIDPIIEEAGRRIIERFLPSQPGGPPAPTTLTGGCPTGFRLNPATGQCEEEGIRGAIERFLPGGQTGMLGPGFGPAVVGAFGTPALTPAQVGTRRKADGSVGPILQCPPGAVLGKDDLCYMKGSIPRQFRKWKPAPRPPVSAGDAKAIRRAERARGRVKKLATNVGFTCRKR